jgi:hypothetical protein
MTYKATDAERRHYQREYLKSLFAGIDYSKLRIASPPEDPDEEAEDERDGETGDENEESELSTTMQQAIAALILANPRLTKQQAAYFLLHNPHGKTYLDKTKRDTPPMTTRAEEMATMRGFAKQAGGMTSISKHIVEKGATSLTEHEFTELLMESAKLNKLAGESNGAAFSRIFTAPDSLDIRKAHQICKNTLAATPTLVVDNVAKAVDANDSAAAYAKLEVMAAALRASSPQLSEAQAFSKVFTDPANAALSNAAHRRPSAADVMPFPR